MLSQTVMKDIGDALAMDTLVVVFGDEYLFA
jgi:hypothetical protein